MPDRTAFISDQLAAATADTTTRLLAQALSYDGPATWIDAHPAEAGVVARLQAALVEGVALCKHVPTTPAPVVWSPGQDRLGCADCWAAYFGTRPSSCDCCDADVPRNEGTLQTVMGPVTIFATVCPDCMAAPATTEGDQDVSTRIPSIVEHLRALWSA